MDDMSEIFGEPIYSYSRAQAIEDGMLVDFTIGDLGPITKKYWKLHFASTISVFDIIEEAVNNGADWAGVLHDIFFMAQKGPGQVIKAGVGEQRHFQVKIGNRVHDMYIHIGPGDTAEGVLTLMLKGED